jgi:hypothetical protein
VPEDVPVNVSLRKNFRGSASTMVVTQWLGRRGAPGKTSDDDANRTIERVNAASYINRRALTFFLRCHMAAVILWKSAKELKAPIDQTDGGDS